MSAAEADAFKERGALYLACAQHDTVATFYSDILAGTPESDVAGRAELARRIRRARASHAAARAALDAETRHQVRCGLYRPAECVTLRVEGGRVSEEGRAHAT